MKVALFGDSIFAGHGLAPEQRVVFHLRDLRPGVEFIPAGVADETAVDGLARVDAVAADLVFVEFGLNDSINGIGAKLTAAALKKIVLRLQAKGSAVVLVEALVPETSRWPARVHQAGLARAIADETSAAFQQDIMVVTEGDRLEDGLHPNPMGARRIALLLAGYIDTKGADSG